MKLSKLILNICLEIINVLTFYLYPKKDRILFISLTQDHLSNDFKLIDDQLDKNKYDVHYILIRFEKNLKGDFLYFLNCMKQLIEIKRAHLIIINDNNYVISHMKPRRCKVLQIWHANGAVKQFGNQIKRQYPIKNYDYVICNSEYWKDIYAKAFDVDKDHVIITGMPRVDTLIEEDRNDFLLKYPELRGKKLCLYAPTFRGNIINGLSACSFDFTKIHLDDVVILYKFHPLLKNITQEGGINMNDEDLYTLMKVSDCMISDYSSVIFDYSLLHKPMIAYVPDMDEYDHTIGFNIDLKKDFPGPICTNEAEVEAALKQDTFDLEKTEYFQMKYMVYTDGKNTQRVIELIDKIMKMDM